MKPHTRTYRAGLTLVELMVAVSILLLLVVSANLVFRGVGRAVEQGLVFSELIHRSSVIGEHLRDDMANMVGPSRGGIMVISNDMYTAFPTADDRQVEEEQQDSNASNFTTRRRDFRGDTLTFIRDRKSLQPITPRSPMDYGNDSLASYVKIWYGHGQPVRVAPEYPDTIQEIDTQRLAASQQVLCRQALFIGRLETRNQQPLPQETIYADHATVWAPVYGGDYDDTSKAPKNVPRALYYALTDVANVPYFEDPTCLDKKNNDKPGILSMTAFEGRQNSTMLVPPTYRGPEFSSNGELVSADKNAFDPTRGTKYYRNLLMPTNLSIYTTQTGQVSSISTMNIYPVSFWRAYQYVYGRKYRLRVLVEPYVADNGPLPAWQVAMSHPYLMGGVSDFAVDFAGNLKQNPQQGPPGPEVHRGIKGKDKNDTPFELYGGVRWYSHYANNPDKLEEYNNYNLRIFYQPGDLSDYPSLYEEGFVFDSRRPVTWRPLSWQITPTLRNVTPLTTRWPYAPYDFVGRGEDTTGPSPLPPAVVYTGTPVSIPLSGQYPGNRPLPKDSVACRAGLVSERGAAFLFRHVDRPNGALQWPHMLRVRYRLHDSGGRFRDAVLDEPGRWFEQIIRVNGV